MRFLYRLSLAFGEGAALLFFLLLLGVKDGR